MKLRTKANGNTDEYDEEEARARLASGLYEEVTEEPEPSEPEPEPEPEHSEPQKAKRTYKRRDLTSE